jgi:DNA-binding response OmpR family regulator
MVKILIVEDDPNMQIGLQDNLSADGYEVDIAGDGETGLQMFIKNNYHLAILDVMLPKLSGFDILRKSRALGISTPVIMLTARGEEIDKVLGLELGADDYMTKPFGLRELLARVKAVLRRNENTAGTSRSSNIRIGNMEVDFQSYSAAVNGKPVEMTPKEFDILKFLWQHQNQTVSRDQLLTNVWGYDDSVTSRTVDNFILRLRQKIEVNPAHPHIILTMHGSGYKMVV